MRWASKLVTSAQNVYDWFIMNNNWEILNCWTLTDYPISASAAKRYCGTSCRNSAAFKPICLPLGSWQINREHKVERTLKANEIVEGTRWWLLNFGQYFFAFTIINGLFDWSEGVQIGLSGLIYPKIYEKSITSRRCTASRPLYF